MWLLVVLGFVGCAPAAQGAWRETAVAADRASLLLASEIALLVVPGNLAAAATPEETAVAAAAAAGGAFDPAACVSTTVVGARVVYVLDGCTGSFGLVRATGSVEVTFSADASGRTAFRASATDLTLRGETVTFVATASVLRDGMLRTIDADITSSSASVPSSLREGEVTARWMDSWGCLFVDDARMSAVHSGSTWATSIEALTYCVGECPMNGGATTWTRGDGDALRLEYGGSPTLRWSVSDAPSETGELTIVCGV